MPNTVELAARVVRQANFVVSEHSHGMSAVRDAASREPTLLFMLNPSAGCQLYFELRSGSAPHLRLADGHGLAALVEVLRGYEFLPLAPAVVCPGAMVLARYPAAAD